MLHNLLDRMPVAPVRRDHFEQLVSVGEGAVTIRLGLALLDADFGNEGESVEVSPAIGLTSLLALSLRSFGLMPRADSEDRTQLDVGDFGGFGVSLGYTSDSNQVPKFAVMILPADHLQFAVQGFKSPFLERFSMPSGPALPGGFSIAPPR